MSPLPNSIDPNKKISPESSTTPPFERAAQLETLEFIEKMQKIETLDPLGQEEAIKDLCEQGIPLISLSSVQPIFTKLIESSHKLVLEMIGSSTALTDKNLQEGLISRNNLRSLKALRENPLLNESLKELVEDKIATHPEASQDATLATDNKSTPAHE